MPSSPSNNQQKRAVGATDGYQYLLAQRLVRGIGCAERRRPKLRAQNGSYGKFCGYFHYAWTFEIMRRIKRFFAKM